MTENVNVVENILLPTVLRRQWIILKTHWRSRGLSNFQVFCVFLHMVYMCSSVYLLSKILVNFPVWWVYVGFIFARSTHLLTA